MSCLFAGVQWLNAGVLVFFHSSNVLLLFFVLNSICSGDGGVGFPVLDLIAEWNSQTHTHAHTERDFNALLKIHHIKHSSDFIQVTDWSVVVVVAASVAGDGLNCMHNDGMLGFTIFPLSMRLFEFCFFPFVFLFLPPLRRLKWHLLRCARDNRNSIYHKVKYWVKIEKNSK